MRWSLPCWGVLAIKRIVSFVDERRNMELVLPVTPSTYQWSYGSAVETIALDQLGDVNLRGGKSLAKSKLELLLPTRAYPFCNPGTLLDPWFYLDCLKLWADSESPIRLIISGTPINVAVLLEEVSYGEEDGSGDIAVALTLREYQKLSTSELPTTGQAVTTQRTTDTAAATAKSYTVQKGDTLSGISKRFYGSVGEYRRIATANGLKNPNLIYPGQVLQIPPLEQLPTAAELPPSAALAAGTEFIPGVGWR